MSLIKQDRKEFAKENLLKTTWQCRNEKTAVTSNTRSFNIASGFEISTSVKNIWQRCQARK
jgi:hypothetical protein